MTSALPESRVVRIWNDCTVGRTDMVTEDGVPVRVIYPGRLNDDRGADLRDAVIAAGEDLRRGDVEVHVKSSGWWNHHHYLNSAYNRVILHVVYWHDVDAPVALENGHVVPTLSLARYFKSTDGPRCGGSGPARAGMPCRALVESRGESLIGRVLDEAGDRRFESKIADFENRLLREEAGQSLYRGIAGALGYTKNKLPMLELARRLPLARLEEAAAETMPGGFLLHCQALLMGAAGLLPSQQGGQYGNDTLREEWVERLEESWAGGAGITAMSPGDWESFKVRPGSMPRRRLAAMSYLLCRCHEEGLLRTFVQEMENASPDRIPGDWLLVGTEGYWKRNLDFGMPAGRSVPALLGEDRAGIIMINVLLPFAVARGRAYTRPGPVEKALEIYKSHPAMAENSIEKHMRRQLGISRGAVRSARRQQGIIHIYKTYCSQGKCGECPLG